MRSPLSRRPRPVERVLRCSSWGSHSQNVIVHHNIVDEGLTLLQKPFAPTALLRKVREVLDLAHRARG